MSLRRFVLCLLVLLPFRVLAATADKPFVVYDATQYINGPDLGAYGIKPISVVYADKKWFLPTIDENSWRIAVGNKRLTGSVPLVLDVEAWFVSGADEQKDRDVVNQYLRLLSIARSATTGNSIGFYNTPPGYRRVWSQVSKDPKLISQWHAANQTLDPLGKSVDAIYLSLYTLYDDPDDWEASVHASIQEARRYGKPVYGFLWPQFHEMNKQLAGQYIPPEFWARQLAFCRRYTDGIVLWGGYKQTWDPNAPWWKETQKFMQQQR